MLQNIQALYGCTLISPEGEIGHFRDFYFDQRTWKIRYLLADTGTGLPHQRGLVPSHAFGLLNQEAHVFALNLTKDDITPNTLLAPASDPHLRSTRTLAGYGIQSGSEAIGKLRDFKVDDQSWTIRELIVETGVWFARKEVLLQPAQVIHIHDLMGKIAVHPTKDEIQRTAENRVVHSGTPSPEADFPKE